MEPAVRKQMELPLLSVFMKPAWTTDQWPVTTTSAITAPAPENIYCDSVSLTTLVKTNEDGAAVMETTQVGVSQRKSKWSSAH